MPQNSKKQAAQIETQKLNLPAKMLALEPRYVFDAALAHEILDAADTLYADHVPVQQSPAEAAKSLMDAAREFGAIADGRDDNLDRVRDSNVDPLLEALVVAHNLAPRNSEIAFINSRLSGITNLIEAVPEGTRIVLIDGSKDGVTQMVDALNSERNITGVHILSHGNAGALQLGSSLIDVQSMSTVYRDAFTSIQDNLTQNADILIYGCDFGAGDKGARAIEMLADLTGADVAASDDLTGAADLAGDWDLEKQTGTIEAYNFDAPEWNGTLEAFSISAATQPVVRDNTGAIAPAFGRSAAGAIVPAGTAGSTTLHITDTTKMTGATVIWANAGFVGSTAIDLRATVLSVTDTNPNAGQNPTLNFTISNGDDPSVRIENAEVRIRWDAFAAGSYNPATGTGTIAQGDVGFFIRDIDAQGHLYSAPGVMTYFNLSGIKPQESVRADLDELDRYTTEALAATHLTVGLNIDPDTGMTVTDPAHPSFGKITATNLVDTELAEAKSGVKFNWNGVSAWEVTYRVAPPPGVILLDAGPAFDGIADASLSGLSHGQRFFDHDGDGDLAFVSPFAVEMRNLDLDASNDTATGNNYVTTFTEGGSAVPVVDTDVDITGLDTHIVSATVTLSNTLSGDQLLVGGSSAASGTVNGLAYTLGVNGSGQITVQISGNTTDPTVYETALKQITFNNTSEAPSGADRQINVSFSNGTVSSNTALSTIHVLPVNDEPSGANSTITTAEDTAHIFTAADFGFSDSIDANTLQSVTIQPLTGGGTLMFDGIAVTAATTISAAQFGLLVYTPATDVNGAGLASFTFQVTDDGGTSNGGVNTDQSPNTVTLNVTPANDPPTGTDKTITTLEETPHTFTPADFGFTDPLDSPSHNFVRVIITTLPAAGTLKLAGNPVAAGQIIAESDIGSLVWTPPLNANGAALTTFTFQVVDDGGTDANLVVNGSLEDTPFSTPSTSIPGYFSTTPPTAADVNPAGLEGWSRVTTINNYGGSTLYYQLQGTDLVRDDDPATTDTPFGDQFGVYANIYQTISGLTPGATYVVSGDAIVDALNPFSTATFKLDVYDGTAFNGTIDNTGGSNPAVIATGNLNSGANGSDPAWRNLNYTFVVPASGSISLVVTKQSVGAAFCNWDNISLKQSGGGANTDISPNTITFNVTPENDDPVAVNDAGTAGEDAVSLTGNVITAAPGADTDVDSDPLTVTLANQAGNAITLGTPFTVAGGGMLTLNADGSYTFEPGTAYNGLDTGETATETISYTVSDGNGGTAAALLVITINGANDAPVVIDPLNPGTPSNPIPATDPLNIIPDVTRNDGQPLTPINVAQYVVDPDGEVLTFTAGATTPSWVSIDPATGIITGTPPAGGSQGSNTGIPGEYLITITAKDPDGDLVTTTVTLTIVNLPPVAVDDTGSVVEDDTSVTGNVIAGADTDYDTAPDSDPLTVTLANQGGNAITIGTEFTTAGGGKLTLNADGSYTFEPGAAYNGLDVTETATETVSYTIDDGNGGTDTALLVITINGANDVPVVIDPANPGTPSNPIPATDPLNIIPDVSTNDGASPTTIDVTDYIVDPDGEPLTFAATGLPVGLSIDPATGLITGTIDREASQGGDNPATAPGVYLVTITATDPDGAFTTTTITYTIVNLPPVAQDDAASVGEDAANATGNVITDAMTGDADTAPDSDPLTVTLANQGMNSITIGTPFTVAGGGMLTLNANGSYTFEPGTAYNGLDVTETATETISYTIDDGNGGTDTALLVITVQGANDTPMVIDPANPGTPSNPIPANDPLNMIPDVSRTDGQPLTPINVAQYIVDPDGEPLSFSLDPATTPSWVSIDPVTGVITGTPPADASQATNTGNPGEYLITITATDPDGALVATTVTLAIINLPPVAFDDLGTIPEDGPSITGNVITDPTTGEADTAPDNDPLHIAAVNGDPALIGQPVEGSTGGTFTLLADGSWTFDPGQDFQNLAVGETRETTITYRVADGQGGTAEATVTVTVTGANDAPVALGPIPAQAGVEGTPIAPIATASAFANPTALPLVFSASNLPEGLVIDPVTGVISGTPANDASEQGPYVVMVTAVGPNGEMATVPVQIGITNPAPVAVDDNATTPADTPVVLAPLANDTDPDGDVLTVTSVTPAANGTATLNPDGTITYVPNTGFTGTETITYTITDEQGQTSTATIVITVGAPPADGPAVTGLIPNQTGTDDQPITPVDAGGLFTDLNGDPLTFTATGLPPGLMIDPATGLITGTLEPDASVIWPLHHHRHGC